MTGTPPQTSATPGVPVPTLAVAGQVLAAQPFSRLLGARLTAFGDRAATLELDIRRELTNQHGYLHGGVLSYAADNALTFAGGTVLGPNVLTAGFTVNYLAPARGRTLRARASVIHSTGRQAVCRCELSTLDDEDAETTVAVAQGTIVAVGPAPARRVPGDERLAHSP